MSCTKVRCPNYIFMSSLAFNVLQYLHTSRHPNQSPFPHSPPSIKFVAASPLPYDGPVDIKHPEKIKEFELTGPYNEETGEYIPLPGDPYEPASTSSNPPSYSPNVVYSDKHVIVDSATKTLTVKHF